jgi:hypothetical protein
LRIKYIPKLALLICCVSAIACVQNPAKKKPQKKGVEYNSYTEQIVENHLILRDKIQNLKDSIAWYPDSVLVKKIHEIAREIDLERETYSLEQATNRKDTMLFMLNDRIYNNYLERLTVGLIEEHNLLTHTEIEEKNTTIDSLRKVYTTEDSLAVLYFNQFTDSIDIEINTYNYE